MAGERLSKITLRASWSAARQIAYYYQTNDLRFTLGGVVERFSLDPDSPAVHKFVVPQPTAESGDRQYMVTGMANLVAALRAVVTAANGHYVVSDPRDKGDDAQGQPVFEFDITSLEYAPAYDLDFSLGTVHNPTLAQGWQVVEKVASIPPVTAVAIVTDALVFGTPTGHASVFVTDGDAQPHTFAWADAPALPTSQGPATLYERTALAAGTYRCTITATSGASTVLVFVVKSDPRLEVQVNTTATTATLVVSGGVLPYAFLWDDGTGTAARTGLLPGTYRCTVTDAHGATRDVEVVISANSRYWFSGNPVTLALDAGDAYRLDPTTKPGLSFVCEVWVELEHGTDVFTQLGQALEQPADATGRTTFEVQELLEPFVAPWLPAVDLAGPVRAVGSYRRFFLKHYERTDAGDAVATTVETNYLLHGGLDYHEAAAGTWFAQYQGTQRPFLTWEPLLKKVLPDQPEYLYFLVPVVGLTAWRYRLHAVFADGTATTVTVAEGPAAVRYEVFCLPAGPAQLGVPALEAAAGQLAVRYELVVEDAAGQALSETRAYRLDRRPAAVRRYFLYANSLGGFNTLVCRGRAYQELATKTTASENPRAAGYDPLRGDYTTSRRTGLTTLKCYTGARSATQLLADQDFMLSERVLLLDRGRYLAGQVKDRTFTPLDEYETRRVVQFDYDLPRERYFTPYLPPA